MISLKEVTVKYGDTIALHPTTITFEQGKFTVLLGASGAGKSTLLRALNMMQPLHSGTITVDGLGVIENKNKLQIHRRLTGMIFQRCQCCPIPCI
jgi:phosphonate transport system ATP-binding protein